MCLFKKKNKVVKLQENVAELGALAAKADVLISLAEAEEIKAKLNKIKDDITYLKTSVNASANRLQNKIDGLLDDVKIKLSAKQEEKVEKILDEIAIAIKERENN